MPLLHYLNELHEQQGPSKGRFVYYCPACSCILRVRNDLIPTNEMMGSPNRQCLGCGKPLSGNIECGFVPAPNDWSDIYQDIVEPKIYGRKNHFSPASSFPHFSLGFPRLDYLLRPFSSGRLVVLRGITASAIAELAAFRAQLPIEIGGLDSAVLFIDGGNRSDPYLFSSFAKQRRLKPARAMRRVTTCRVFTFYQLGDLVSRYLMRAAEDYGSRLVIISDLLGTFNEPELEEREARRVLCAVEEGTMLAKKKGARVIVTLPSPNKYDGMVEAWADTAIGLTPQGGQIQAELLKHPSKPPTITNFKLAQLMKAVH